MTTSNSTQSPSFLASSNTDILSKDDLAEIINFSNCCVICKNEEDFHTLLLALGDYLGYEFVLYCYTKQSYTNNNSICWKNLTNPSAWDEEYAKENFLPHDPVRHEMERLMAEGIANGFIHWDNYIWELSSSQQKVIDKRKHYGLHYGFSCFADSENKDSTFLFSFASKTKQPTIKEDVISRLLIIHFMAARKRLDMLQLISTLSDKENEIADYLVAGKTNWEIAEISGISENTVKFHLKNIFTKLQANNRQQAIAILLAERFLSI